MGEDEDLLFMNSHLLIKVNELSKLVVEKENSLIQLRQDMDKEVNDLTSSLFTEATNMVNSAKMETLSINQKYEEASMRLEMFEEEIKQLKKKIESAARMEDDLINNVNKKNSPRSFLDKSPKSIDIDIKILQVDIVVYNVFVEWIEKKCPFNRDNIFIKMIIEEDVLPSMKFPNKELSSIIVQNIVDNKLFIDNIKGQLEVVRTCDLCHAMFHCPYRIQIADQNNLLKEHCSSLKSSSNYYQVSDLCRLRIVSIVDLFNYLRYISHGLVKCQIPQMYLEICRKRLIICNARYGFLNNQIYH